MAALGIDAFVHDSFLRRRPRPPGLVHRLTWHGRELTLPWEVGSADVLCTPLATLLPLAARLRRRPKVLVISYHLSAAYARAGRARRRLQRAAAGAADHIVSISEEGRRLIVEEMGVEPARVSTATLGVDERFWRPTPLPRDGYVLTVGRDLARDYGTFAEAVSTLPLRAIVVAKEENVRGVKLPPNVEVRLNVSPLEVRELYRGAACVVVPVRAELGQAGTENSGTIALLEAMASARPAVVTDRPFLADYLEPGRTALTVPAEDPAALRARIIELLDAPDAASDLAKAGRARIEAQHTTRRFAGRLAALIELLLVGREG
jgi:glycosyltransferase involved in cell wall biosynthesis